MFKSIPALVFSALLFGLLAVPISASAASGAAVANQTELEAALVECDGTPTSGAAHLTAVITVTGNLTVPAACTGGFTLDLNSQELNGKSLVIASGATLTITDSTLAADGKLNMTATDQLLAGIHVPENSNLNINKGVVTAAGNTEGYGAGIGSAANISGGVVNISGGTVNATGGYQAAGIGGGQYRGDTKITISGGTVTATAGQYAAGIGGGEYAAGEDITISGGTVTATGGEEGAGIGGGYDSDEQSNILITGGTVTAQGGEDAAGIGGGAYDAGGNINISGGTVNATGSLGGAGIGTGYAAAGGEEQNITISAGTVVANGGEGGAGIGGGKDTSGKNITLTGGSITATGGGIVNGGGAGIGGGHAEEESPDGGIIKIEGGTVIAQGGYRSAGIGGGRTGDGGSIEIIGGTVTATGSADAAGIGGGRNRGGGTIFLGEDAVVTAIGGNNGAGIGGGRYGNGGSISIESQDVTATGKLTAAGIGGGDGGDGADVSIDDGAVVTAVGGNTAVGSGENNSNFGYLELAGELRVPSGAFKIHNSIDPGVEVTIETTGKLLGNVVGATPTVGATIYGDGQIQNDGVIALTAEAFADSEVQVLGNFYIVNFDPNGGDWLGNLTHYVFAPDFASSYRDFPTPPAKSGFEFKGWLAEVMIQEVGFSANNLGPAGVSGSWVLGPNTSLRDNAGPNQNVEPGDGVDIQATAQWEVPAVAPAATTVYFSGNSTKLTKAGKAKLKKLVQGADGAKITEISVKGSVNTKRKYWPLYNKWLANKRAKNVAAYVKSFSNTKSAKIKVLSPSKGSKGKSSRKVVAKVKVAP